MVLKISNLLILIFICTSACEAGTSKMTFKTMIANALESCLKLAVSINEKPDRFTIPQTIQDIRYTCKIHDEISMCLKNVSETYLPSTHQSIIEDLVQSSMPLCREDINYQRTYLPYAPCIKRIVLGSDNCGNQYQYLLDHVKAMKGKAIHNPHTCCTNHKFRECYMEKSNECDQEVTPTQDLNKASEFIGSMMDQAIGAVTHLCITYVPNEDNCPLDSSNIARNHAGNDSKTGTNIVPSYNSSNLIDENTGKAINTEPILLGEQTRSQKAVLEKIRVLIK